MATSNDFGQKFSRVHNWPNIFHRIVLFSFFLYSIVYGANIFVEFSGTTSARHTYLALLFPSLASCSPFLSYVYSRIRSHSDTLERAITFMRCACVCKCACVCACVLYTFSFSYSWSQLYVQRKK